MVIGAINGVGEAFSQWRGDGNRSVSICTCRLCNIHRRCRRCLWLRVHNRIGSCRYAAICILHGHLIRTACRSKCSRLLVISAVNGIGEVFTQWRGNGNRSVSICACRLCNIHCGCRRCLWLRVHNRIGSCRYAARCILHGHLIRTACRSKCSRLLIIGTINRVGEAFTQWRGDGNRSVSICTCRLCNIYCRCSRCLWLRVHNCIGSCRYTAICILHGHLVRATCRSKCSCLLVIGAINGVGEAFTQWRGDGYRSVSICTCRLCNIYCRCSRCLWLRVHNRIGSWRYTARCILHGHLIRTACRSKCSRLLVIGAINRVGKAFTQRRGDGNCSVSICTCRLCNIYRRCRRCLWLRVHNRIGSCRYAARCILHGHLIRTACRSKCSRLLIIGAINGVGEAFTQRCSDGNCSVSICTCRLRNIHCRCSRCLWLRVYNRIGSCRYAAICIFHSHLIRTACRSKCSRLLVIGAINRVDEAFTQRCSDGNCSVSICTCRLCNIHRRCSRCLWLRVHNRIGSCRYAAICILQGHLIRTACRSKCSCLLVIGAINGVSKAFTQRRGDGNRSVSICTCRLCNIYRRCSRCLWLRVYNRIGSCRYAARCILHGHLIRTACRSKCSRLLVIGAINRVDEAFTQRCSDGNCSISICTCRLCNIHRRCSRCLWLRVHNRIGSCRYAAICILQGHLIRTACRSKCSCLLVIGAINGVSKAFTQWRGDDYRSVSICTCRLCNIDRRCSRCLWLRVHNCIGSCRYTAICILHSHLIRTAYRSKCSCLLVISAINGVSKAFTQRRGDGNRSVCICTYRLRNSHFRRIW